MPKMTINGAEYEFDAGMTIIQVCDQVGIEIPRFCYHDRLKIAGNCRMCLVQVEGGPPKPAASCAFPAADGMVVNTNTPMVKKAREGVMEFLLANHPLDCPICDQAGECDLQDQSMAYGRGASRFSDNKRSVKDKDIGPLVKTEMTRCIHCTRCVRFLSDVAGVEELGMVGRGEKAEITTYVEKSLSSELSGNIIDLCPVGALTSKPYAFTARSWELVKTESIDVLDAVGSNIRIDSRGKVVMRILPRLNEDINEEWISDKTRFSYDGLKLQRLDKPYIKKEGKLTPVSWEEAYFIIKEKFNQTNPDEIAAIAGDMADCESMFLLKELLNNKGCYNHDCRQDGSKLSNDVRASYVFNTGIAGIEQADLCLIIGSNPRWEAPIINARIKKCTINNNLKIALIGEKTDLTYKYDYYGNEPQILEEILSNKNHDLAKALSTAKKPMIVVGASLLTRDDGLAIMNKLYEICQQYDIVNENWQGFNLLQNAASRVGGMDLGFLPQSDSMDTRNIVKNASEGKIKLLYLLGSDEIDFSKLNDCFIIYQGHHGDKGAHAADVILPGAAYTEKDAIYVNTEGRVQTTKRAIFAPNEAKEDWQIINELIVSLLAGQYYSSLEQVRLEMQKKYPIFAQRDILVENKWSKFGQKSAISNKAFENPIKNFYMTDVISRVSKTMSLCVEKILKAG